MNFMIIKRIIRLVLITLIFNNYISAQDQQIIEDNVSQDNYTSLEKKYDQIIKSNLSISDCSAKADNFLNSRFMQSKAIPYLRYILLKKGYKDSKTLLNLAKAYYYDDQFDIAVDLINNFIESAKNSKQKKIAKEDLEVYKICKKLFDNSQKIQFLNLGEKINSKKADIIPYVSTKEDVLVYSSDRAGNFDIYVSLKKRYSSKWGKAQLGGRNINSSIDDFVAGLSADGKDLLIHYNETNEFIDINTSKREKGLFSELGNLGNIVNSEYKEEGACISHTGDTLFIASDRPGGFGGFDLYYSLKLPNGEWGKVVNLGSKINTEYDENYPNLSISGKTLYFASKGHKSMGGYDLFKANFDYTNNEWTSVENLGYPINNAYDNKTIRFTDSDRYAYVSAVLKKGFGDYDIYKAIFLDKEPDYLIVNSKIYIDDEAKIPFSSLNLPVTVSVYNANEIYGLYSYDKKKNLFIMALEPGKYIVEVEAEGFKPYRRKVTIKENHYRSTKRKLTIKLSPEEQ